MRNLFVLALLASCGPSEEELTRQAELEALASRVTTLEEGAATLTASDRLLEVGVGRVESALEDEKRWRRDDVDDLESEVVELYAVIGGFCEELALANPLPQKAAPAAPSDPSLIESLVVDAFVREVVEEAVANDYGNLYGSSGAWLEAWSLGPSRGEMVEPLRWYLSDPTRLWKTYQAFKRAALEVIAASGKAEQVKARLGEVAPLFITPVDPAIIELSLRQSEADRQAYYYGSDDVEGLEGAAACSHYFERESERLYSELREKVGASAVLASWERADAIQFMLRRQGEGGEVLARTYGSIMVDLERSIVVPPPPPSEPAPADTPAPASTDASSATPSTTSTTP